jgi:hypothetical protein
MILSISGTNKVKVEQGKEIGYISPKASEKTTRHLQ